MDKKRTLFPSHLWLIAIIVVAAGLAVFSLSSAQTKEKQTEEPNKAAMMEEKHEKMHECTTSCVKDCQASMEDIAAAKAAIKAAIEAIDKGESATAKSELEKAEKLLTKAHKCMKENIEKMPCANMKCPISGKPIDKMDRPQDCTRMYKGMKIGFCCPNCPPEWDKLTDAEKDAKLKECMPPKKQ
jgi:hypothetical protein